MLSAVRVRRAEDFESRLVSKNLQILPRRSMSDNDLASVLATRGRVNVRLLESNIHKKFVDRLEDERNNNKKLSFYNRIKTQFGLEPYLTSKAHLTYKYVKATAKLRMSAHGLAVETGRHGQLRESIVNRTCVTCWDRDGIEAIAFLPFFNLIIENNSSTYTHSVRCSKVETWS